MNNTQPQLAWMKSSYSLKSYDWKCVETATDADDSILIRDSKNLAQSPIRLPRQAFTALLGAVKSGQW